MLSIAVREGGSVKIGEATIFVRKIKGSMVHLAIGAPSYVRIVRDDAKKKERRDRT